MYCCRKRPRRMAHCWPPGKATQIRPACPDTTSGPIYRRPTQQPPSHSLHLSNPSFVTGMPNRYRTPEPRANQCSGCNFPRVPRCKRPNCTEENPPPQMKFLKRTNPNPSRQRSFSKATSRLNLFHFKPTKLSIACCWNLVNSAWYSASGQLGLLFSIYIIHLTSSFT